jgi:hypothetical protein
MMRGSEIYWLLLITSQNSLNYFQFGQWMLQCQLQLLARCLVQIFARDGHMRFILLRSHRGANFVGDVCKTLLELWS